VQLRFEGALVAMTTDANEKTQLRYFRVGAPPYSTAQVRMLPLLDHGRNENDYYFSFGRLLPEIVASPLDRFRAVGLHEARRRLVLQKVSSVALPVSVPLSHTEVDPQKRTPILLKRRCRNGQASYPVPGGIPGANG
jgi:hypothetical protein